MDKSKAPNKPHPLTIIGNTEKTRDRIMLEATLMFARKGYTAASVRDIARQVGIRAASLYNHFASKELLWDAAMEHVRHLYRLYFERLEATIAKAETFEEVLDCLFAEVHEVVQMFTYYGISLIHTEQLRDPKACEIYNELFLGYSTRFIKEKFDMCIEKGWVSEFDTNTVATIFMHSIMIGNTLRTHADMGHNIPYDVDAMYNSIHFFFLSISKRG